MNLIQSITVTPKHITLMLGQWYYSAKAEICPSSCVLDAVVWYSDNEEIAGVNQDNGFISANGVGTARIYAITTDGNALTDYLTVTVIPVPVEGICINEGDITLHNGTHCTLTAAVYPSNATNKEVEWYSEDERIAYVDPPSGVVFANKVGQTKICAVSKQNGHVRGCCTVTVIPPIPVTGVQITSSAPQTMKVGDTATLVARVLPSNATNQTVIWSSSDPNVATINANNGYIEAKLTGSVVITATAVDGSLNDCIAITVQPTLSYPDTLIDHANTRSKIIRLKTLIDENTKAYLEGKISLSDKNLIENQLELECNIARADYIVVGNNPTSDYAYSLLGGNKNSPLPSSFSDSLRFDSTGLAVIVVQRALEVMGYYDPKDSGTYGVFDSNTYDAASLYPNLLSYDEGWNDYVFDNASFNVLFGSSTLSQRTYEEFNELNQYKAVHNTVALWCACKVGGTYTMSDNKIAYGNSTNTYYGYADVLKDTGSQTYIWEVKPNKERYYTFNGIGERQLRRYLDAGNTYEQNFSKPLTVGYNIGNFSIPFLSNSYIDVTSHYREPNSIANGLILYSKEDAPHYTLETEPVPAEVPEPSVKYNYSSNYTFELPALNGEVVIIAGIIVAFGVVFILVTNGAAVPLLFCAL